MFIEIEGGKKAAGELSVQGSKNAVLPMIAAAILCKEPVVLERCPKIQDVYAMISMLRSIGVEVFWDDDALVIDAADIQSCVITEPSVGEIRASVLFLGSLLGRCGQGAIGMPGGCSIGARPIDYHVDAFSKMGIAVYTEKNQIFCKVVESGTDQIRLPYPSVGATENVILYAVLGTKKIHLENAAKEPEIVELCRFLRSMGADIRGEGTTCIEVQGVRRLHATKYCLPTDRIVFLTYAAVAAASGGDVFLKTKGGGFEAECSYLTKAGCQIQQQKDGIRVKRPGAICPIPYVETGPYPAFPTDAQSLFLALLTKATGESVLAESVFENRFLVAAQLRKMGADIEVTERRACVRGVTKLHGDSVVATDLRSGAALMVAAVMADGVTRIGQCHSILRGYEWPVECLRYMGICAGYRCE